MIKEVNQACKKLNKIFGISVTLPDPNQKTLKTSATCNLIIGTALVTAGALLSSKTCAAIGGISIVSSMILRMEGNHKTSQKL